MRHDPVRVGAGDVGVGVDHLRLDPQAELHAAARGPLSTSGCSPSRPDVGRDVPVAEPGVVVAARAEPAVVEHEPLDADLGRTLGQLESARSRSWSK